ncbi:MAG: helix-turn-helix transcriptional regulator [Bacillaceae bacterium]
MGQSTKDRILELIKKETTMTVNELSEHLAITHMAVRKHLNTLEKDQLVQVKLEKQPMGRPLQIYSLTDKGERLFPKNYEGITLEFLHDIKDMYGEESIEDLFKKREKRLAEEYIPHLQNKSNTEKIQEIVNIQNQKGYMANAEEVDENTFELTEHNCPILTVANEFKVACQCETSMLENILEADQVRRVSCKTDGNNHCKFLIKFK